MTTTPISDTTFTLDLDLDPAAFAAVEPLCPLSWCVGARYVVTAPVVPGDPRWSWSVVRLDAEGRPVEILDIFQTRPRTADDVLDTLDHILRPDDVPDDVRSATCGACGGRGGDWAAGQFAAEEWADCPWCDANGIWIPGVSDPDD